MGIESLRSAAELSESKPHGIRLKYMGGCRCLPCRAANSRYESSRLLIRKKGGWNGIISADKARAHMIGLQKAGIGRRTIYARSGISETILGLIRNGSKKNIRKETEKKILAVSKNDRNGACLINARPTWALINRLLREGFTKRELSARLGYKSCALQINKKRVTVRIAKKIESFYRKVMTI